MKIVKGVSLNVAHDGFWVDAPVGLDYHACTRLVDPVAAFFAYKGI